MTDRIAIVFDGQAWFVRHIRQIEWDIDFDEKVYRCDQPISGPHATLADVPQVATLLTAEGITVAEWLGFDD